MKVAIGAEMERKKYRRGWFESIIRGKLWYEFQLFGGNKWVGFFYLLIYLGKSKYVYKILTVHSFYLNFFPKM